jgi:hypothetical protein
VLALATKEKTHAQMRKGLSTSVVKQTEEKMAMRCFTGKKKGVQKE